MKKTQAAIEQFLNNRSKRFYIITFIISSILLFTPLFFTIKFQELRSLGLLGIFMSNFLGSATVFLPAPSIVSVIIGGAVYHPLIVALLASTGSAFGEAVGFLFGLSTQKVTDFKKHKILYSLLDFIFQKYGVILVIIFSLIPNPLFDGIGILAGFTSFSIKRFMIAVFIGRLTRNIALAYFGQYL